MGVKSSFTKNPGKGGTPPIFKSEKNTTRLSRGDRRVRGIECFIPDE